MGTYPTIIFKTNVQEDSDTNPYNFYTKIFHGCMVGLTNGLVLVNCLYRTKDDPLRYDKLNPRGGNMQHWQIFFPLLLCCNKKEI